MNFTSQICTTKEQSERLLALGLKRETADCFWLSNTSSITGKTHCRIIVGEFEEDNRCVPAWSLHRLIELAEVSVEISAIWVRISSTYRYEEKDNAYDNLIDAIADLIYNDVFNKEYLEE